jgi:hypothetical protein
MSNRIVYGGIIYLNHNAWVVGNEPVVAIGIEGMAYFAKKYQVKRPQIAKFHFLCFDL